MNIWDWVFEQEEEAYREEDRDRIEFFNLYFQAQEVDETDPDRALDKLKRARALAEDLDEPWWALLCDQWRVWVMLQFKGEYARALDLAARATVEARKPIYQSFPQRVCLHEDLIQAYIGIDPEGHADRIQAALDYMAQEIRPDVECRHCLLRYQARFALERGRLGEVQQAATALMASCSREDARRRGYYSSAACSFLCWVGYQQNDGAALLRWAQLGVKFARDVDKQYELAELLAWQALAARRAGDEDGARTAYRLASAQASRSYAQPSEMYYTACCAYHEAGGGLEAALDLRGQQLARLAGKGQTMAECRCRLERCRLLFKMGRPLGAEVAEAQEAAKKLKAPAAFLESLERVTRPEG